MPILIDYNQFMIASLFASIGNSPDVDIQEDLLRHMFLNSMRSVRNKFHKEYGELVICADGKNSWRKEVYKYYKANRKKGRDASSLDWGEIYRIMDVVRNELAEFFPYKVLQFERVEADDIIGVICHENGEILNSGSERYLIMSSDKDYIQLQQYANVDQYNPIRKEWVRHSNPDRYLKEHVLKGDSGDGIPNILSASDCFMMGIRQKPMTKKRLDLYINAPEEMDEDMKGKFERNTTLIDLSKIPKNYWDAIVDKYAQEKDIGRSKLFNFFISRNLKHMMTDIGDF